jgi:hypothetical protein
MAAGRHAQARRFAQRLQGTGSGIAGACTATRRASTHESLLDASQFIATLENRRGLNPHYS